MKIQYGYLGFTDKGKFPFKMDFVKQFNEQITNMKKSGKITQIIHEYILTGE